MNYRIEDQAFLKEIKKNVTIPHQLSRTPFVYLAKRSSFLSTEKMQSTDYVEPHFNLVTDGFLDIHRPQQLILTHLVY